MSNIEIEDFLPIYPYITSDNFYEDIYHKKEFYDVKVPIFEKINKDKWDLLSQQKIITRFLSSRTPYDHLLLHHEMGSGKSCAAIGAIENVKKEEFGTMMRRKTLIVCPGPGLLDNFVQEIILTCTNGYYKPDNYDKIRSESERMRVMRQIAKKNGYLFLTYGGLAKELQKLKISKGTTEECNKNIIKIFSNMFIVMDEIQHLRPKNADKDDITIYNEILNMCKCVRNTKILAMSGTPMRDGPEEIASILNLFPGVNLPLGDEFISKFMIKDKNGLLDIRPEMIKPLKDVLKGRVSYLASMQSDITKNYITDKKYRESLDSKLKFLKIDIDVMSKFQSNTYKSVTFDDKKSFELDARQACLFCYPPLKEDDSDIGVVGKKGFDFYIEKVRSQRKKEVGDGKIVNVYNYKLKQTFRNMLMGNDEIETINKISKYSSKYAKTITQILNAKDKCIFIYCDSVQGSGCILFSLLLELIGFKKAYGNETTEEPRYALLSDITTTKLEITKIKNRFNNPDNMFGKYIKIIIGSTVVSEGFSLYNVQEEHILTPHWNYTPTSQALARGMRVGSHNALINAGIKPTMNIYQHGSVYKEGSELEMTIDIKMYELSEEKDISIKRIDRIIKESSFDCALTYERNRLSAKVQNSRECEYQNCNYECDGISKEEIVNGLEPDELDYSTYNLYYSKDFIDIVISKLEELFLTNFTYHYRDIKNILKEYMGDKIKDFELITSLRTIINNNLPIKNKYRFVNYLKEDNNIYFLVDNLYDDNTYLSSFYTKNPVITTNKTFIDDLNYMIDNNIEYLVNLINKSEIDNFSKFIKRLPIIIQEHYIESVLLSIRLNNKLSKDGITLQNNVMTYFKSFIHLINDIYISSFLLESNGILRCLKLNKTNYEWVDCDENLYEDFKNIKLKSEQFFVESKYGYYSIDTNENIENVKDFKIIDLTEKDALNPEDKRLIKKGMKCIAGWKKTTLLPLIRVFKLEYPSDYLSDKNKNSVIEYMKNTVKINKSIEDLDLNSLELDELKRIAYWTSKTQNDLCSGIKKFLKDNDLLRIELGV